MERRSRQAGMFVRLLAGGLCCVGIGWTAWGADPPPTFDGIPSDTPAQPTTYRRVVNYAPAARGSDIKPTAEALGKANNLIADVVEPELVLVVQPTRSKLMRTKKPVSRTSITNDNIAQVVQLSPTEFEIIGLRTGETTLTFWFGEPGKEGEILRYLLVVSHSTDLSDDLAAGYKKLEEQINETFPNSQVQLVTIADKLIIRGQARDNEEAMQILQMVRGQSNTSNSLTTSTLLGGSAVAPYQDEPGQSAARVINLLRIPGEQQVLLRVRIAEMTRTALRELGVDFSVSKDSIFISSVLGVGGNISAIFDNDDISLFMRAVSGNGNSKILAEPNLVTLSGQTASFIAGGQFAVPTIVGVNGVGAAATTFQGFGTQLLFTPTVLDKDQIRLRVAPTFSTLNNQNTVNGIPGLNTRSVSTTVDMRAGQWLAIAGLLQDEQRGSNVRVPGLGDIPFVSVLFSHKRIHRDETELIVLVSPELVHPLEEEQLPLFLPGMDVTEPGPVAFYGLGMIEGFPDVQHRSTVFPNVRHQALREAMRNAKACRSYQKCESFYVTGAHGFSQ